MNDPVAYLIVNDSDKVVENIVMWNGNPDSWTPPANTVQLIQSETIAKIWDIDGDQWVLVDQLGGGQIGFFWDSPYVITNEPMPEPPVLIVPPESNNPENVSGTQTL